jgi:endonuclease/exonuclease/phosphatase family metal-dependent hydrolase
MPSLSVATFNTESGGRPGFHAYLNEYIEKEKPDVVALQEVHQALNADVPATFMPRQPGKRIYPPRLRLYQELVTRYDETYEIFYTPHLNGLHDCERGEHSIAYGQVTMVRRETWEVKYLKTGLVFGESHFFNTEHAEGSSGTPSSKAAITTLIRSRVSGECVLVTNVHGMWVSRGKIDIPERFTQNQGIAEQITAVLRLQDTALVLCVGDLNYRSDMKALKHLQTRPCFGANACVLNHKFGIVQTRTTNYTNWKAEPEADFMVASAQLATRASSLRADLTAPSDHALLEAKFVL